MKTKHAPFSLYKKKIGERQLWYARFWDGDKKAYISHRALGIEVGGKKERRGEAEKAAAGLMPSVGLIPPAGAALIDYVKAFWNPDGKYFREAELTRGRKLSAGYARGRLSLIHAHIEPYGPFQNIALSALTPQMLRDFMLWETGRGVSADRVNNALDTIRAPVRYALDNDELDKDPFRVVKKAFVKRREKGCLTPDEAARLISCPSARKFVRRRVSVLCGLLCGMRLGEVRGLMWEDLDLDMQTVSVRHNWQDSEGVKRPKYNSAGVVPLPAPLPQLFKAIRDGATSGLVFGRQKDGAPRCKNAFGIGFSKELEQIGIPPDEQRRRNLSFHSLRHSFVSLLRLAGLNDFQVQTLARHKNAAMMDRYSHGAQVIDLDACRAVIGKFVKKL